MFLALFFLGIIQGLTEFLPISSSGHLVLFSKVFGIEESLFVSIILHVATLCSILVVYRKDVFRMIRHPFSNETMSIVIATIPTCVIALILLPIIKTSFSGVILPFCFFVSAFLLFFSEKFAKNRKKVGFSEKNINFKTAFFVGVAQGFAIFPGVSRSGSTISAALICGAKKEDAAKFSFLTSIPIILMSMILDVIEFVQGGVLGVPVAPLVISFLTAFVVGIFAIKVMTRLTVSSKFKWFGVYLIFIGIISFFVI